MRILLATDSYPPLIGGATRAAFLLGQDLADRGHRVVVVTVSQREAPPHEYNGRVEVFRLPSTFSRLVPRRGGFRTNPPPIPDPELSWRIWRIMLRLRPDVLHTYGWITYSCLPASLVRRVPVIVSARDYGNICALRTLFRHGAQCSGPGAVKCMECAGRVYGPVRASVGVAGVALGRRLLRSRIDALHSCSTFVDNTVSPYLARDGSIRAVIPDFREELGDDAHPDTSSMSMLPSEPFILYVGALRFIKGVHVLLQAYEKLAAPPPLVLLGPAAPDSPQVFPRNVTAIPGASHPTVMATWDRALFGVAPSLWPEPLGNVVHEGMSRGKAVIGTYPGGHGDMIEHGRSGLLVPAGDVDALAEAMACLIVDERLRARIGAAARLAGERFTRQNVMPEFESLYRAVEKLAESSSTDDHMHQ